MPSYKLTYFNARGRGEAIRLIFTQAGIPFEDNRIKREDWPALKPNTPFGQMPILELDGSPVKLSQSKAIARFAAKKGGLTGKDDIQAAMIDSLVDTLDDISTKGISAVMGKDEEKIKEFKEKSYPETIGKLEKLLGSRTYFVGDKLSWADIYLFAASEMFTMMLGPEPFKGYPKLAALAAKVKAEPKIAAYLKSRPETEF